LLKRVAFAIEAFNLRPELRRLVSDANPSDGAT